MPSNRTSVAKSKRSMRSKKHRSLWMVSYCKLASERWFQDGTYSLIVRWCAAGAAVAHGRVGRGREEEEGEYSE